MNRITLMIIVLILASLACSTSPATPRTINLYPTVTGEVTQTPLVVVITQTPNPTTTPVVVIVTQTKETGTVKYLCVSASEAVYLRPAPNKTYSPIDPLPNGTKVIDTVSRDGNWAFVTVGERSGWVNLNYLVECE